MFEIKAKDNRARVGTLKTSHGTVRTPALMPVIHPRKQTVDVKKYGADIVITNAYLIYKDEKLKAKARELGLHDLINFDGPVMTDSGSFQLSVYGDIDISNTEVIDFQEEIGSDIGTSLDIPTAPYVDKEKARSDMEITIDRAKEAIDYRNSRDFNLKLNSVVQGSTFPDLRVECAERLSKLGADLYPIGAVVPLMEGYDYKNLVHVVMNSMKGLSDSVPRHLMGAGHPMIFALCVAMGCDLFDSAAYILYAEDDRLLSTSGTYKLENLTEMPCSCEVCSKYTPDDLRAMPKKERVELIAAHNLYVSFAELRLIRQAISEGSLMELVEQRCRAHPALLDALRELKEYTGDLEYFNPSVKKSAFFYTGCESLNRPEVLRHKNKLENIPKKKNLVILGGGRKPYSRYYQGKLGRFYSLTGSQEPVDLEDTDFAVLDIPFGITPLDLDETYPLAQNIAPRNLDDDSIEFLIDCLTSYSEDYEQILIHSRPCREYGFELDEYEYSDDIRYHRDDLRKIKLIADYEFGCGSGDALFTGDINIEKSRKTGKIRHIYDGKTLIANMRASDANFVLSDEGARRLHAHKKYPENRVVIHSSVEEFARDGKSVFSKFVTQTDKNIRAQDEVLITNDQDDLLAYGKVLLNPKEIKDFQTGQAVKVRKGFKKE